MEFLIFYNFISPTAGPWYLKLVAMNSFLEITLMIVMLFWLCGSMLYSDYKRVCLLGLLIDIDFYLERA